MDARKVLLNLVYAEGGIESLHVDGVAVALPAKLGDRLVGRLADESFGSAHGPLGVEAGGVASMAILAKDALGQVDVLGEFLRRRRHSGIPDPLVALNTGVVLGQLLSLRFPCKEKD